MKDGDSSGKTCCREVCIMIKTSSHKYTFRHRVDGNFGTLPHINSQDLTIPNLNQQWSTYCDDPIVKSGVMILQTYLGSTHRAMIVLNRRTIVCYKYEIDGRHFELIKIHDGSNVLLSGDEYVMIPDTIEDIPFIFGRVNRV